MLSTMKRMNRGFADTDTVFREKEVSVDEEGKVYKEANVHS